MGPENAVWGIAMMLVSQVYMAQEKNQRQFATPTIEVPVPVATMADTWSMKRGRVHNIC